VFALCSGLHLAEMGSSVLDPYNGKACGKSRARDIALIFAFEDEVGQREQGARIFGISMTVEAGFCAARVDER